MILLCYCCNIAAWDGGGGVIFQLQLNPTATYSHANYVMTPGVLMGGQS